MIKDGIDTFNKSTVALKNVVWIIGILVAIVFFYFKVDDHIKNEWLHRSYMKDIRDLENRVHDLEWQIKLLKQSNRP